MKTISSKSNPYIKFIRSLRNKKGRDQSRKFYIEGILHVGEALRSNFPLESVIYAPAYLPLRTAGNSSTLHREKP